jgi:hypothetical protein
MRTNIPLDDIVQSIKIEDKIIRVLDKIRKIARSDTKSVVHYTKIFVADIYVSSLNSRMHYSNAIYMNDPMEGRVFFEYLNNEEIKQAYLKGEERNESSVYLGSFLPAEDAGTGKSFEDELVMWRTYGKDESGKEAAGCNVVLSSEFFRHRKKPETTEQAPANVEKVEQKVALIKEEHSMTKSGNEELLNVIYINDKTIKNDPTGNIKPALDRLKSYILDLLTLKSKEDVKTDLIQYIENTIFRHLSTISYFFKTADYFFENEVRVIEYIPRDSDEIKFRIINEPGSPKKRFYIESSNEILPFIKKILLGPKVENHQQWSLYFDYEIRQRNKEIENMNNKPFHLNPSDIAIFKSKCKFQ